VRPAALRNPVVADLGIGGTGTSEGGFFCPPRESSAPPISVDDGAVEALLWCDELSVNVVLVVLEDPLPLKSILLAEKEEHRGKGPALSKCTELAPGCCADVPIGLNIGKNIVLKSDIGSGRPMKALIHRLHTTIDLLRPSHLRTLKNAERGGHRGIVQIISGRLPPSKRDREPRHIDHW